MVHSPHTICYMLCCNLAQESKDPSRCMGSFQQFDYWRKVVLCSTQPRRLCLVKICRHLLVVLNNHWRKSDRLTCAERNLEPLLCTWTMRHMLSSWLSCGSYSANCLRRRRPLCWLFTSNWPQLSHNGHTDVVLCRMAIPRMRRIPDGFALT